ncbi:hypothetical protein K438DRAFT_1807607 [Mycena galopus ATCC 62051]|nr:hypothetical protein K438DRAFT_1807607 [Mycena galopus ATCC 62051]
MDRNSRMSVSISRVFRPLDFSRRPSDLQIPQAAPSTLSSKLLVASGRATSSFFACAQPEPKASKQPSTSPSPAFLNVFLFPLPYSSLSLPQGPRPCSLPQVFFYLSSTSIHDAALYGQSGGFLIGADGVLISAGGSRYQRNS